ncbi:MAG: LPS export ABC transporter permease LptG [Rhizobiales bacterium]|nr:LPS export ABC transporter permease LptG [Hyphomicrobiales bacterium]
MGLLGRYIAGKFIVAITGAFVVCLVLIYLVDFIEILRQSGKYGGAGLGLMAYITLLRMPAYGELTLPFATLVGTIGAFLMMNRSSELVVVRAAGISVWQFALPGIIVAGAIGVATVGLYNPLAAVARAHAEELRAEAFGREQSLLRTKAGAWLRQDSIDGQTVLSAKTTARNGLLLGAVTVLQYDREHHFVERVDAATAELRDGFWELEKAWVSSPGEEAAFFATYQIATYLTPEQVTNAIGSIVSVSVYDLPRRIELARRAGLPTIKYELQMSQLLARPAMLAAMVLLGATVSLRAFRFGGIQTMVVVGIVTGFGFFILAEMSRQVGLSGLVPPQLATWVPIVVATSLAATALLHQEDG